MRERGFPVSARGVSARSTVKASAPSIGQPVAVTGVPVSAGDPVVADDGVFIVPSAAAERTLAADEQRAAKEAQMMAQLSEGTKTLDLLGLGAWRASR
jgi:4-hydroxy-4-methyl-2-oxoglutarate aldolase